jgi:hypothetical protein
MEVVINPSLALTCQDLADGDVFFQDSPVVMRFCLTDDKIGCLTLLTHLP